MSDQKPLPAREDRVMADWPDVDTLPADEPGNPVPTYYDRYVVADGPVIEGSVQFWIETLTGTEMAMMHAADYRAAMNERDHAVTEVSRLKTQIALLEARVQEARHGQ